MTRIRNSRTRRWRWSAPRSRAGTWRLMRRGVQHGQLSAGPTRTIDLDAAWSAAEAIPLPGLLRFDDADRRAIQRSRAWFERMRTGQDLSTGLWKRLRGLDYAPAGSSVEVSDAREIEKVYVDRVAGGRRRATGLYAKLSWVADDERDHSLRIRFSFGAEHLDDWQRSRRLAQEADQLTTAVFPETDLITENPELRRSLRHWVGARTRLSERIVYANAPGGGATFHHDAEPGQRGVVYAQLAGRTLWLALPKRRLAELFLQCQPQLKSRSKAMQALESRHRWAEQLDADPQLTRSIVDAGYAYLLRAGDVLVLPSHGLDDAAWHSVFALGRRPSLAHSYGLFAD